MQERLRKIGFKKVSYFVKIVLSACFLYVLFTKFSTENMLNILGKVKIAPFLLSTVLIGINPLILTKKFMVLFSSFKQFPSFGEMLRINIILRFYSFLVPSSVGVWALRGYKVWHAGMGKADIAAIILIERLLFLLVLDVFAIFSLSFSGNTAFSTVKNIVLPVAAMVLIALFLILAILKIPRIREKCFGWLSALLAKIGLRKSLERIIDVFSTKFSYRLLGKCILLGVIWHLLFCLRVYLVFVAVNISLSIMTVMWIASIALFLQILPLSFAGLGIRESVYAFFLIMYGFSGENGVMIGFLLFFHAVILGIIGWFLAIKESKKNIV